MNINFAPAIGGQGLCEHREIPRELKPSLFFGPLRDGRKIGKKRRIWVRAFPGPQVRATEGTLILIWNDHRDRGHQPSFLEDQGWGTGLVEVRGIPGAQRRGTWGIQPSLFNSPPAPGPHGWRAAAEVELRAILGPMQTLVAWNTRFRGWNYFQFPD